MADSPARSAPSRPGAASTAAVAPAAAPLPAVRKFAGTDYVAVADVARYLGLTLAGATGSKKLTLTGRSTRAEFEADTRDISVNGVRVFLGDPIANSGGQLYVSRVDFERCLTPMLRPGHGIAVRPSSKIIVLDPGHGGSDPGKTNTKLGVNEKTFALDVALRTRKLLVAGGHRVVLTREDDRFVALTQRAVIASVARADAFVSIHFNALANDTRTSGVEVYTFAPRFQRSTNAWGPAETNDTEHHASPGNRFDHWNVVFAHAIHRRFVADLKTPDRGKKLMHLAVLRPLSCPGILVECGFLTSETEARKIATAEYRQQIAVALAAGIGDYVATLDSLRTPAAAGAAPTTAAPAR